MLIISVYKKSPYFLSQILYKFTKMQPQLFVPSYLKHTYLYSLNTKIAAIQENKILFQDTIFHPQGGGQPKDKGWIQVKINQGQGKQKRQIVNALSNKQTGQVWNQIGNIQGIKVGDQVTILIDEATRVRHAKLHSAGHLIDLAVQNLGFGWQTAKGYHFEDGPYVQYKGANQNLQQKAAQLNAQLAKIISSNIQTVKQHYSYQQAVAKGLIPKQFKTPLIRVIKFQKSNCPCGGTHIQNTNQIKKLQISKLQKKGKFLRANYIVQ